MYLAKGEKGECRRKGKNIIKMKGGADEAQQKKKGRSIEGQKVPKKEQTTNKRETYVQAMRSAVPEKESKGGKKKKNASQPSRAPIIIEGKK